MQEQPVERILCKCCNTVVGGYLYPDRLRWSRKTGGGKGSTIRRHEFELDLTEFIKKTHTLAKER